MAQSQQQPEKKRRLCRLAALALGAAAMLSTGVGRAHEPITTKVMFNKEVIRILQKNCLGCHKPGGFAPFSLVTYEEARPWAKAIKEELLEKRMPPLHSIRGYGDFQNAPPLTQREIEIIVNWVEGGAPKGDDKSLPVPLFSNSWPAGMPDQVLRPVREQRVAPDADRYQDIVLPTGLKSDRLLRAIELLPGNDSVVHCATFYVQNQSRTSRASARSSLGTWVPGNIAPNALPEGYGIRIPAGASIVARIHYKNSGSLATDLSSVGLYFLDSGPGKAVHEIAIANGNARIQAGDERRAITASVVLTEDTEAVAVLPAVDPLLVSIEATAYCPDGTTEVLFWVRGYRFGLRPTYIYKKPFSLPKGTRIETTAYFDNSDNNKYNPSSPPAPVQLSATLANPLCILMVAHGGESSEPVGK